MSDYTLNFDYDQEYEYQLDEDGLGASLEFDHDDFDEMPDIETSNVEEDVSFEQHDQDFEIMDFPNYDKEKVKEKK